MIHHEVLKSVQFRNIYNWKCFRIRLFQVFVCNGEVHIIPIPSNPAEVTVYPTGIPMVHQALQVVFGPHRTVAEERVQRAIRKRIQGYR